MCTQSLFAKQIGGPCGIRTQRFRIESPASWTCLTKGSNMVEEERFELSQPEGNGFTVCCDSPSSPLFHMVVPAGFEPAIPA